MLYYYSIPLFGGVYPSIERSAMTLESSETEKKESLVGNMVEAFMTYGAGLFWYGPVCALLIFGPWEWVDPESQLGILSFFLVLSLFYDSCQRVAANTGIQPKFASRTMRLFADIGASAVPLLIPLFMIVLALMKVWTPQGSDLMLAGFMAWFALNDLFGNSNIVHTALRRVSEVARDR